MKYQQITISEVSQPNSEDEINFKEKHVIDHILDPNAEEDQFTADKIKKFKNRADYSPEDSIDVYEDAEQIDEISRSTLINYAKKAPYSAARLRDKASYLATGGVAMKKSKGNGDDVLQAAGNLVGKAGQRDAYFRKAMTRLEANMPLNRLDPHGQEDDDIDNDGDNDMVDSQYRLRNKSQIKSKIVDENISLFKAAATKQIMKKLKMEGISPVVPTGGEYGDQEKSHVAYKKANKTKETTHIDPESADTQTNEAMKPIITNFMKNKLVDTVNAGKEVGRQTNVYKASQAVKKAYNSFKKLGEDKLDEAFVAGSMKLKDGSKVNVSSSDAKVLNALFASLNPQNKSKMQSSLMADSDGFKDILDFAKEAN